MVALAWKWFVRLDRLGKDPSAFPSALATFAARAVVSGRRLCGQEPAQEVLSPLAGPKHGFTVGRLSDAETCSGCHFGEALRDNTKTPVPEQVCFRHDFSAWLGTLSRRDRRLVAELMRGERPSAAAKKLRL